MNYNFVIDASHGGSDSGVSGNNLVEKNYSLDVSKYIYNKLNNLGYSATLVRSTDESLSNDDRISRILNAYGNKNNVIVISNHLNEGNDEGVEIIYALRHDNVLANDIASSLEKSGVMVNKVFQRRLPSDTSKDYYFIHRDTGNTIPISIYYGYVDNKDDVDNFKDYQKYGDAIVSGILAYVKNIPVTSNGETYIVKSGDSLWSIAKRYGVSIDDIKKANNLSSNLLNIGQVLIIPSEEEPPEIGDFIVYTVSSGDNLYKIATKYNLTVDDLVNYNDLATTNLSIGQQLLIPVQKTSETQTYIVKSGDTLYSIASKYGISVNALKNYNNLTTNVLSIGQKLNIPVTSEQPSSNYLDYAVKKGDSLYSIASKYNTGVSDIMKINNLNTSLLNIGMVLKIPVQSSEITYIVQSGDNLYSIARKYNTTIDSIKNKNNLTSNNLSIGQILII
mgnify:FL=1